jgi:hypothetical protein
MNPSRKNGRPGKKSSPDPDKVAKILTEARQVVDDLERQGGPPAARRKKSAAPPDKKPRPRTAAKAVKQPATRPRSTATAKAAAPRKPAPSPARAKKLAGAMAKTAAAPPATVWLSPRECGIRVLHSLPGRVRFRIRALQYDDDFARELESKLPAVEGITEAWASPATGSLLIYYHPEAPVAVSLGKALQAWFPRLDTESLLAEMLD